MTITIHSTCYQLRRISRQLLYIAVSNSLHLLVYTQNYSNQTNYTTVMEYVRAARLVTQQTRTYMKEVIPLARQTFQSLFTFALLLFQFLYALARPLFALVVNLYDLLSPTFFLFCRKAWNTFCLQSRRMLAIEAGIGLTFISLSLVERRFRIFQKSYKLYTTTSTRIVSTYTLFLRQVRVKSQLAALAVPHAIFLILVFCVHTMVGDTISSLTHGAGLIIIVCIRPVFRTILLLYSVDIRDAPPTNPATDHTNSSNSPHIQEQRATPKPTPIRALRRRSRTTAEEGNTISNLNGNQNEPRRPLRKNTPEIANKFRSCSTSPNFVVPFVKLFDQETQSVNSELNILRFWIVLGFVWGIRSLAWYFSPRVLEDVFIRLDNCLFYFFMWAELDITRGADIVYSIIAGLMHSRWQPSTKSNTPSLNLLLRLAVAAGFLDGERASELSSSVAESGLPLVGVIFLITPRVATFVGTVAIGFIVPCYLSSSALRGGDAKGFYRHNWLSYWSVFFLIEAGYAASGEMLGWLPLWYHIKMCIILWLQLPYFRGSVTILERFMGHVGRTLSLVGRQAVASRKRKFA